MNAQDLVSALISRALASAAEEGREAQQDAYCVGYLRVELVAALDALAHRPAPPAQDYLDRLHRRLSTPTPSAPSTP